MDDTSCVVSGEMHGAQPEQNEFLYLVTSKKERHAFNK